MGACASQDRVAEIHIVPESQPRRQGSNVPSGSPQTMLGPMGPAQHRPGEDTVRMSARAQRQRLGSLSLASKRLSRHMSVVRGVIMPEAQELLARSPMDEQQRRQALATFSANQKNGEVPRAALVKVMESLYAAKSVPYDASVSAWIDATLLSLGKGLDDGLAESEFVLFHSCGTVFVNAKVADLQSHNAQREKLKDYDKHVFLGGSCNPTTWRKDIAIPRFQQHGITFYNPQTDHWHPGLIDLEALAKDHCHCLLFVIDSVTRAISSMLEVVEYVTRGATIYVVIEDVPDNSVIDDEKVTGRQLRDLNRGRAFLADVVMRHHKAILCDTLNDALDLIVASKPMCSRCGRTTVESVEET